MGLKYDKKSPYGFDFFSSLLPFIVPPYPQGAAAPAGPLGCTAFHWLVAFLISDWLVGIYKGVCYGKTTLTRKLNWHQTLCKRRHSWQPASKMISHV